MWYHWISPLVAAALVWLGWELRKTYYPYSYKTKRRK